MAEDDKKRITNLESDVNLLRSDLKHIANNVVSNANKLDLLLQQSTTLHAKTDTTIQTLNFIQENHRELKIDFKKFRREEYEKFKTGITEKVNQTRLSSAKLIGVAGAASGVIYGLIETVKTFMRGGG